MATIYSSYDRVLIHDRFECSSLTENVSVRPLIFQSINQSVDQFTIDMWIKLPTTQGNNIGLITVFMNSQQYIQLVVSPRYELLINICVCYSSTDCSLVCILTYTSFIISNINSEYIALSIKIENHNLIYSLYKSESDSLYQNINTSNKILNTTVYNIVFGDLSTTGQLICNNIIYKQVHYYNNYFDSINDFNILNQNGPGTLRVLLLSKLQSPMNEGFINIAPNNNSYFAIVKNVAKGFNTLDVYTNTNFIFDYNRYILMNKYIIPENLMDKSYMVGIRYLIN